MDATTPANFARIARGGVAVVVAIVVVVGLVVWRPGCSAAPPAVGGSGAAPVIRVRLLANVDQAAITCAVAPDYRLGAAPGQRLGGEGNAAFNLTLGAQGWSAGESKLGGASPAGVSASAVLILSPAQVGSVTVNGVAYRGALRFVPTAAGRFDVVNDVALDDYLAAVVAGEMYPGWHEQAYRAQAIVARTYALYERQTAGTGRHWDVYPDTRSQMYGGLPAETKWARAAVAETAGIVLAAPDADGQPRIFKAYFSSCCGGVSQSAADAFGEGYVPALSDQNVYAACRASPRFNWGPVEVSKSDLTARFVRFGQRRGRPEAKMATITRIDVQQENRWGRPIRFLVTDLRGNKFSLSGEEFRWAVNTGAPEGSTLYSSFVKVISDSDRILFVEGHGWGHGVGLCQYCAEKRAEDGLAHEHILLAAYPTASLVRAY
ncbi:MAG TPA: SpoIID/LytB domain-containing protein [Tepidisphaeraceae bacterium]|nr:SpoIID/LytB domain-containing protein [Tepidisphaeraceae bacterium]